MATFLVRLKTPPNNAHPPPLELHSKVLSFAQGMGTVSGDDVSVVMRENFMMFEFRLDTDSSRAQLTEWLQQLTDLVLEVTEEVGARNDYCRQAAG